MTTVASDDRLFLKHNVHLFARDASVRFNSHVFDLSTLLLDRLQAFQRIKSRCHRNKNLHDVLADDNDKQKFIANLEHLLLCIQQAALQALVRLSSGLVEADVHHWHQYWKQRKQVDDAWFTEWPGGRHPLSTTWPWNIKPSLLVLWGVCWMFYSSNEPVTTAREQDDSWGLQATVQVGQSIGEANFSGLLQQCDNDETCRQLHKRYGACEQ